MSQNTIQYINGKLCLKLSDKNRLKKLYKIERLVTRSMNGDKKAVKQLRGIMPSLFKRGTKTYTILEPFWYEANKVRMR